ncbi:MAG: pilin [Candidatus Saccharibacteria bacterium]|nr:pilin [Candidatus Saccharibacteria bacterium]
MVKRKSTLIKKAQYIMLALLTVFTLGMGRVVGVEAAGFNDTSKVCDNGDLDEYQKAAAGCGENRQVTTIGLAIVQGAIGIAGLVAVVFLIVGGYRYMTAQGDPGKLKQAKTAITWSVIGVLVAVLSFAIVSMVSGAVKSDANQMVDGSSGSE